MLTLIGFELNAPLDQIYISIFILIDVRVHSFANVNVYIRKRVYILFTSTLITILMSKQRYVRDACVPFATLWSTLGDTTLDSVSCNETEPNVTWYGSALLNYACTSLNVENVFRPFKCIDYVSLVYLETRGFFMWTLCWFFWVFFSL